jgi:hypothetical protein
VCESFRPTPEIITTIGSKGEVVKVLIIPCPILRLYDSSRKWIFRQKSRLIKIHRSGL